jgi:PAS domain S-box-containing protein
VVGGCGRSHVPRVTRRPERTAHEAASDVSEERESRFEELLDGVDLGAVMLDSSGAVQFINDNLLRFLGCTREEVLGHHWIDAVVPTAGNLVRETFAKAMADGSLAGRREDPIVDRAGNERVLAWTSVVQRAADGGIVGLSSIAHDVTEARGAERERTHLVEAIEQSAESVLITDNEARITYVNKAFERISGYASDDVIGLNPRLLKSHVQTATFYDAMWAALANGLPFVGDVTNRRKDGSLYHITSTISPIRAADRSITGFVSVGRDVTRERELETRTEALTHQRALIGETLRRLPSGGTVTDTAELFCRQVRNLGGVAVTALGIFESDGSAAVVAYAGRDTDTVGLRAHTPSRSRYLRDRAEAGPWVEAWRAHPSNPYAEILARAGVRAAAYAPVAYEGSVIGVLAVGSAEADAITELSGQLGAIVDFANLAGALLGRRVAEGRDARDRRASIEAIIERRAFTPVFQPIVDMIRGGLVGYEALTRFADGTAPDRRFADAVAGGLGIALERATLEAAIGAASALSPSRFLHLNVSPALVLARTDLRQLLGETRARIVLEVTEHVAIGDYREFRAAIDAIGRPVLLAVDDAGAGFASFRHILELQPAFIKLDISLIRGIDDDLAKQALVAGLHYFGRKTGRRLIAEGVENESQAAALRAMNIRLGQGYLFGRPTPLAAESPATA